MRPKIVFKEHLYLAHEKMKKYQNESTLVFGSSHAHGGFDDKVNGGGEFGGYFARYLLWLSIL